ncbi:MAG: hypothetical protein HFI50_16140 [Lachnospiraceae bacterium]|nr:hypothetical protein [Lachnospiraceae bacterium]
MKRKTIALMTAVTLSVSLSACGDKTALQAEIPDTTSVEETAETTEEAEVTEEESTKEEETIPEITQEEKVQSALGEMPYYGDTSKCAMTAEQATAYAQLIADGLAGDFSFRGGYNEDDVDILTWGQPFQAYDIDMGQKVEVDRFNVMLTDFAGDGVPYLYVYSSTNEDSYEIYGWTDNIVDLVVEADARPRGSVYYIYEDENDYGKIKLTMEEFWSMSGETIFSFDTYSFANGAKEIEAFRHIEELQEDNSWHIIENDVEIEVYTDDEYYAMREEREQEQSHNHTLPYTCFYDMTPCTLEEMVNYLNAYATAMSDGQSVPVEIKKVDIVKHDGTGITTKGEVSQEKVNSLEILRQYMNGELVIANGNADSALYSERFYFGLEDINNDGIQELILSDKYGEEGPVQIHFPPSYECLMNVWGFDSTNNTYMVSQGSVCIDEVIYTYDGTSFSIVSSLEGEWDSSEDGSPYTVTENGTIREISKEEFWNIENDWSNRHTRISAKSADIHLDIENIEKTFQVKIDIQSSGEWLVTSAE